MGLRAIVDTTEGMAADVAALYKKNDTSGKYELEVDGMVEKSKVDEFRTNNIELSKKLELYKGVDLEEVKKNQEVARQLREKELISKGDLDTVIGERVSGMKTEYETKINGLSTELDTTKQQLSVLLIDSQVRTHSLKNGVLPEAADDVLLRAKNIFKLVDGKATAMDGEKIIYGKDGVNPLTIEEWMKGLHTTANHLFTQSTGSGARGNRSGGGNNTANMTSKDKIAAGLEARQNA